MREFLTRLLMSKLYKVGLVQRDSLFKQQLLDKNQDLVDFTLNIICTFQFVFFVNFEKFD